MLEYPKALESIPCPVEKTVALIGSKWSILIVRELFNENGSLRFSELFRRLEPISSRTLSKKLKELNKYEVIEKIIKSTSPPSTYYSLNEKGKDLASVLRAMAKWSLKWHSNSSPLKSN